jgi:autotransporter strand-loop-strand O-heptosyltransferase
MSKFFLTHTTENYESVTINLARSIKKYSKNKLIVYTVDYDASEDLKNLAICRRIDLDIPLITENDLFINTNNFYVNRNSVNVYYTLSAKIDVMIDAVKRGAEEWVYIDGDSLANVNVDELFDYVNEVKNIPLATKGPYEYIFITHQNGTLDGNPFWKNDGSVDLTSTLEWQMMDFFNMNPEDRGVYCTTNILVGTKNTLPFLELWKDVKNLLPRVTNTFKKAPLHEETIFNVLKWKFGECSLPMVYINAVTCDTVEHFLENETENDVMVSDFYKLPKEKSLIKVFHGVKNQVEIEKIFNKIDVSNKKKPRILFLAPHLSTGGMPGFLLKRILTLQEFRNEFEIFVVEYANYSDEYVVQRNIIKHIIPQSNYFTLGENKLELIDILKEYKIDLVHIDDNIESLGNFDNTPVPLMNVLYDNNRTWAIVETCHNVSFKPELNKRFHPEAYAFCSPWHKEISFSTMPSYSEVIEFPIDTLSTPDEIKKGIQKALSLDTTKIHVVNVGLWTPGKNQREGVEIARLFEKTNPQYEFHFIGNQAPNFKEYWEPIMKNLPKNVKVWGERNDVSLFIQACDIFMFNSTWECNPLVLREAISFGKKILARNLTEYMGMFDQYITPITDNLQVTKSKLIDLVSKDFCYLVPDGQSKDFAHKNADLYKKVIKMDKRENTKLETDVKIIRHFVNQPFLEILGESDSDFRIEYYDENGECHYRNTLKSNHWIKLNREYFTKWNTKVYQDDKLIYDQTLDLTNQRVFISFDSKSLGDSVAWIPYVLEFQTKHNCKVIVSTFWNKLFREVYPELEFVEPGSTVHNLIAMYKLGWFYNMDMEPVAPNLIPLQKTASNILGLEHKELQPRISYEIGARPMEEKYVTIATNSTSGLKFWTRNAWQELVDFLIMNGYSVINVSKEKNPFNGVYALKDTSIENTMNVIHHSEFLVGLSSGLSWLAWGMGKHVVMISNFTTPDHEFTSNCTRITNPSVCNGCWNKPRFTFDKGDWNWCPEHKGTPRQFECHTSITSKMVIDEIKKLLK